MNEPPPRQEPPPQQERPVERRWLRFYASYLQDLRDNLIVALPLLAFFAFVAVPASATLLCLAECGRDFGDWWTAVWVTWQAMTTMGFDSAVPVTPAGRVIVSIDALLGYALLGVLVFLVARAAEREGKVQQD